jgi:response regulator NasT
MAGEGDVGLVQPRTRSSRSGSGSATTTTASGNTPEGALRVRPERLPDQPQRVVIADDDPILIEDMLQRVCSLGIEVCAAAPEGAQAIHECREHLPDLALFDLRMPRLDGASAANTVFHELAIPVVVVSAHAEPDDIARASAAGVFGYLVKPVTTRQVRAAIEIAWQRYAEHVRTHWEVASLRTRLQQRKTIERAKWHVVQHEGVTEPEALRMLQQRAREERAALINVARDVLESAGEPSDAG